MHFLQAISSDVSVFIVCSKTGGTIKRRYTKKVALAFIKAHHNIKVFSVLHSRVCEYINILSFDYYRTIRNAVNSQTTPYIIHQFLEIPPHIKVINVEKT